jgi:hypothetical protein
MAPTGAADIAFSKIKVSRSRPVTDVVSQTSLSVFYEKVNRTDRQISSV